MMRYLPAKGTAGTVRSWLKIDRPSPRPPARTSARTRRNVFMSLPRRPHWRWSGRCARRSRFRVRRAEDAFAASNLQVVVVFEAHARTDHDIAADDGAGRNHRALANDREASVQAVRLLAIGPAIAAGTD